MGDHQFPRQVLFTDEYRFTRDAVLNPQSSYVWDDENLHSEHAHGFQQHFRTNVLADIVDGHLIGPYLLPPCLMGHSYLLAIVLGILLEDMSLNIRRLLWFQPDGPLPHLQVQFLITLTDFSGRDG